jgi:hypothetical protein
MIVPIPVYMVIVSKVLVLATMDGMVTRAKPLIVPIIAMAKELVFQMYVFALQDGLVQIVLNKSKVLFFFELKRY